MKSAAQERSSIEAAAADWIARCDAGLTAAEQAEFDGWQAVDPRHTRALERHHRAWSILDRPIQGGRAGAMVLELNQRAQVRRQRRAGAVIASVVVLCIAAVVWQAKTPVETVKRSSVASTAVVVQPEKRVLSDGSVVELKTGAEIEVNFSPASSGLRWVALKKGEVHFQVAKNPVRPFVVSAGNIEFRAVGTAFSLQLGRTQVEVLVTEGSVAVEKSIEASAASPTSAPPTATLTPEPLATVDAGTRLVVELTLQSAHSAPMPTAVAADEMAQRLAWRSTRLEFTGTPLDEAAAVMNQHNRVQFVVADSALAKVEVSGFFRADNAEAFLLLLEGSFGVKAERSGDTITLRKGL